MAREEMVIFTRTFDFLTWLLPATNDFPRAHRYTFTRRLLDAAFDLRERLEEANHRQGRARSERLERADEALERAVHEWRHEYANRARMGFVYSWVFEDGDEGWNEWQRTRQVSPEVDYK